MKARSDGRGAGDLRPLRITTDFTENPLASVLIEMGRTRVLCTVCEENGVPRWLQGRGRGWITAEYAMLPGATDTRSDREVSRGRPSGRSQEIQRLIGRSLRAVADLAALGERTLWVDCDVLQADGGTRCASITGAYVGLALGVRRLLGRGALERDPLRDTVAAVSAGVVDGQVLLDLPYAEDARAAVDMNVVATGSGRFVEVQGTGEEATFSRGELDALTELALEGIAQLTRAQQSALEAAK
ncbi:MAG: ribonuclease PH [Myxococcota bacterium]|nr:ribonuclease PH [Deltaproteobacteria bacterium]MCP4239218.1 ribonuclease PH [bacterium]MDP6075922.1 ribonuclease PH [Myxococcota bacterium]MDP6242312.1 ribonuclease PH [Myxococcota bacterium]MDP7076433.1 ribonuclease PH [Myxococcota bacterium]